LILGDDYVLCEINRVFGSIPKPEHFTNYLHCEECAEHDELLRSRDCSTLRIDDVGNPGWDPLCFTSPEGIGYFMPALAKLALDTPSDTYSWYGDQLLFHLFSGAEHNGFFQYCDSAQRKAIALLLTHFIETRFGLQEFATDEDDLLRAHELWSVVAR